MVATPEKEVSNRLGKGIEGLARAHRMDVLIPGPSSPGLHKALT